MGGRVLFIRHAMPSVDQRASSRLWPLSEEGHRAAKKLAERLQLPADVYVVSSDEVKAQETAKTLSGDVVLDPRLHEVARPWTDGDYKGFARDWLRGEPVEDWESHRSVLERMSDAVEEASEEADGSVIVVTHGIAMSAYLASIADIDPVAFWSDLAFPDARLLDQDNRRVEIPAELSEVRQNNR